MTPQEIYDALVQAVAQIDRASKKERPVPAPVIGRVGRIFEELDEECQGAFENWSELYDRGLAGSYELRTCIEKAVGKLSVELEFPRRVRKSGVLPDSLHPAIAEAAQSRFESGHYADAVVAAAKMLNKLVRDRSGRNDLDGTTLMDQVFSPKNPLLAFNARNTQSEKDEQEGMYLLYKGAVLGVRNPRAHDFLERLPRACARVHRAYQPSREPPCRSEDEIRAGARRRVLSALKAAAFLRPSHHLLTAI